MVSEFGVVSGAHEMKAEIFRRGPISCGIDATESTFNSYRLITFIELEAYTGGIFQEHKLLPVINHVS
jgi:cathepsin X